MGTRPRRPEQRRPMTFDTQDVRACELSGAMTETPHRSVLTHLLRAPGQENLTFAYWRPSLGEHRLAAIICDLQLPQEEERLLSGNASFTGAYLRRVLRER